MRKIKTDELAIASSLSDNDPLTVEAFKTMVICVYVYDEIYNTNHLKNIKKIYLNRKNENLIKLSDSLFTESRSLTRYRKKYLKCFKVCSGVIRRLGSFFEFMDKLT